MDESLIDSGRGAPYGRLVPLRRCASLTVALVLAGCSSTPFLHTWTADDRRAVPMEGRKVLVVAADLPRVVRLGVEATVADELRANRVHGVGAYEVLEGGETIESVRARLQRDEYDAAIVIRGTDGSGAGQSPSGGYRPPDRYRTYWAWGGGWDTDDSVPVAAEPLYLETLVYSVREDRLVWSGLTPNRRTHGAATYSRELVRAAITEMKKSKLLL